MYQGSNSRDVLHVLKLGEPLGVVERLHEHLWQLLLFLLWLVLEIWKETEGIKTNACSAFLNTLGSRYRAKLLLSIHFVIGLL